ncbi:MAG: cytochrome c [Ignavibacteria bacterium]|nr:MAG: cytochrome c [Ignavibacteria bacterium]KAF0155772.1 MAG: cytochrome c [Ignavibacteria bacterium]
MKKLFQYILLTALVFAYACGGGEEKKDDASTKQEKIAKLFGITVFELENGIGPIKEKITLGPLDNAKAAEGKMIFEVKCSQCHKLDERYTGPAVRNITKKRTPEYILNNILNPEEMANKHPEAKKLVAIHATKMTFQNVTKEDALKILEYFRSEDQ